MKELFLQILKMSQHFTLELGPFLTDEVIIDMENQICKLESFIKTPPSIILYDRVYFQKEESSKWEDYVLDILRKCGIPIAWTLSIITSTDCVKIQFVSHSIKNKVYRILSDCILPYNSDVWIEQKP
jgi:hypothetical protein